MKVGIVGLPNAGKSSLFNALTSAGAATAGYPFTTVEPNVAVVPVRDDRLEQVAATVGATRVVPETIEFHDIAGLVRGAHEGEGLGNRFLANIRETDAIVHVVRAHGDEGVVHPEGNVDPLRDIETIETELVLADLDDTVLHGRTERAALHDGTDWWPWRQLQAGGHAVPATGVTWRLLPLAIASIGNWRASGWLRR